MVTFVLDSSALLRYFDGGAGAERVEEIIKSHLDGTCEAVIAAPHWGETAGMLCKIRGRKAMETGLSFLNSFGLRVIEADAERSVKAALVKVERKIPYVDAFGVALAAEIEGGVLLTADFDFKRAARDVKIEFLPVK